MKEKQIKIEAADIERLAGIYPEMNEAQLEEIALGEKMGLGFSEYASAAIPAEEMKAKRQISVVTGFKTGIQNICVL